MNRIFLPLRFFFNSNSSRIVFSAFPVPAILEVYPLLYHNERPFRDFFGSDTKLFPPCSGIHLTSDSVSTERSQKKKLPLHTVKAANGQKMFRQSGHSQFSGKKFSWPEFPETPQYLFIRQLTDPISYIWNSPPGCHYNFQSHKTHTSDTNAPRSPKKAAYPAAYGHNRSPVHPR